MPRPLGARLAAGCAPYAVAETAQPTAAEIHRAAYLLTPHVLADLAAMAIHLRTCERLHGRFRVARSLTDAALGFVSSRLVTTAVVCTAAITAFCLLT